MLSSDVGLQRSQVGMLSGEENIAHAESDDSLWLFPILISYVDVDADPMLFLGLHQ